MLRIWITKLDSVKQKFVQNILSNSNDVDFLKLILN